MIFKIADNIVSPLGFTTAENFNAVRTGRSAIRRYEDKWEIPDPFMASLIDRDALDHECGSLALYLLRKDGSVVCFQSFGKQWGAA